MATNAEDSPPEFFDTVKGDNLFDIVHPTRGARGRWRDGRGAGSGRKVTTLGCRGIEPKRPRRVKWVLAGDVNSRPLSGQARRFHGKGGPLQRRGNGSEC